eukprot:gene3499-3998_t
MAERDLSNAMKSMNTNDVEDDSKKKSFESLNFDNLAITSLPYDDRTDPRVRRRVQRACFASAQLCPVENPETVIISQSALSLLDIDETEVDYEDQLFAEYFAGNKQFPGSQPSAHCYCGHQFGYFSGQLGDGAAMYLGEVVNRNGERWELQLKGSGPTAFSRQADGRKVLRSSLREFLCSEAMYFLGIPTTRSASCVTSDTRVVRDMFYDGNPMMERATIISRIAPTFLRFGSFEIFKPKDPMTAESGPSFGHADILHQMLSYTIQTIFPEIHNKYSDNQLEKYSEFFKEVVLRTAKLVADWQCVGFCHGVLNTDNMSIAGLTIDYGPFGFMDYFNPDHICNSSDDRGRYTYQNQPSICKWNLLKLAEALQDALPLDQSHEIVKLYDAEFHKCFQKKMRKKLGLLKHELDEDIDLFTDLFETMRETRADFTNTFRYMSKIPVTKECDESDAKVLEYLQRQCQPLGELKKSMKPNSTSQQIQLMLKLVQSSPEILAQLGDGAVRQLEMELEKLEKFKTIEKLTEQEKAENDRKLWRNWIEKYRKRLLEEFKGTEEQNDDAFSNRIKIMNENNPRSKFLTILNLEAKGVHTIHAVWWVVIILPFYITEPLPRKVAEIMKTAQFAPVFACVGVLGIICNLAELYFLPKTQFARNFKLLLRSLVIADCLLALTLVIMSVGLFVMEDQINLINFAVDALPMKALRFIMIFSNLLSLFSCWLVTMARFIATFWPARFQEHFKFRKLAVLVVLVWLTGFAIGFGAALKPTVNGRFWVIYIVSAAQVWTFVLLVLAYMMIFKMVRHSQRKVNASSSDSSRKKPTNSSSQVASGDSIQQESTQPIKDYVEKRRQKLRRQKNMELAVQMLCTTIVLRNYVAQHAIENADEGRYEEARQLLKLLEKPYDDIAVNCKDESRSAVQESESVKDEYQSEACAVGVKKCDYDATVPSWATSLRVS